MLRVSEPIFPAQCKGKCLHTTDKTHVQGS